MSGWKTLVAGISTLLYAIGQFIYLDFTFNQEIFNYIITALAILGVGHKLDKMKNE